MRVFGAYAAVGAAVLVAITVVVAALLGGDAAPALWIAAALAYAVQLPAFALLLGSRGRRLRFLAALAGGMMLRLGAVGVGVLLVLKDFGPPAPLLLGLAGFVFLLLMLEPVFFRFGVRSR